jgi:hypothetical protein
VAADQRLQAIGHALEGHVLHRDARLGRELLDDPVRAGAHAGRAVGEPAGVGLAPGHQLLDVADRRLGPDHQPEGVAGQAGDPGEVLQRVELHLLHVRHPEHALRQLGERVPVRLGVHQLDRTERAGRAGPVLDQHVLAQRLAGALGEGAHHDVGRATMSVVPPAVQGQI